MRELDAGWCLTVVIPSYNCAEYLPRAVKSAFAFQDGPVEVLVVDDGSTDETPVVCTALRVQYPALKVLRKPNGGLSSARNHGVENAQGSHVLFLDADDELIAQPSGFRPPADCHMLRLAVEEVGEDESVRYHGLDEAVPASGLAYLSDCFAKRKFFTPSWAYVYQLRWYRHQHLEFMPGLIHEDVLFTVQALLACENLAASSAPAYRYFRRAGSITTARDTTRMLRRVLCLAEICSQLTPMANRHSTADIGWWVLHNINYAAELGDACRSRRVRLQVLKMELRFYLGYKLWGVHRSRLDVRYRIRMRVREFWCNAGAGT